MERQTRRWNPHFIALCVAIVFLIAGLAVWRLRSHTGPDPDRVVLPDDVIQAFLPENEWSRPGTPLEEVNGIVIHYVGNPNTSAMANRNYFETLAEGTDQVYASSHFIVGLEGEVVQCIPLTEIAYASNTRNSDTIAIEVCHPDETGEFSEVTYDRLVALTADLCAQLKLDPEQDVIRHYDVTGKLCPLYYVEHEDAWLQFLDDVRTAMQD